MEGNILTLLTVTHTHTHTQTSYAVTFNYVTDGGDNGSQRRPLRPLTRLA